MAESERPRRTFVPKSKHQFVKPDEDNRYEYETVEKEIARLKKENAQLSMENDRLRPEFLKRIAQLYRDK